MLDKSAFAHLIPHAGRMCLLDEVVHYDDDSILCRSGSHRLPDNPLRKAGRLSSLTAVEYAAQAMALHGALLAQRQGRTLPQGFIGSLREGIFHIDRLDTLASDLDIQAQCLLTQASGMMYECEIQSGKRPVFSGRIGVFFTETGAHPS